MRLFVAMDLTDSVRAAIAQFRDKMCRAYPSARWVRPEGMHITLKFIGEIGEERVNAIRTALGAVHSPAPVHMAFRKVGFFPNERRPRVFWVGIEATPNLADLAAEIETRLASIGIAREARAFKPHLTVARFDEPRGLDKLHAAIREAGEVEFGSVRSSEMHLYESNIERGGARYTRIESFSFAPMQ